MVLLRFFLSIFLFLKSNCLENGLARTPPMGWMSWTAFYCEIDCVKHPNGCINEKLYMDMTDRLVEDGYLEAGYKSVHIDDCWMAMERDSNENLVANQTRFPSGMKYLADYMHSKGVHFGTYEDYGTKTCGGYPGSYHHLKQDAQLFASWGVDYLKLDGCWIDPDLMPIGYPQMEKELNATGRPIVYSCSWPAYLYDEPEKINYTNIRQYCNLWRNFGDVSSSWRSIHAIISYYDQNQDVHIPTHGPGGWHDPDMLVIGNPGITKDMAIAQMTIWTIWSAPLIMSNDLRTIGKEFKDILLNKDVIRINQDPMGRMGRLVANTSDIGLYVKPIHPIDGKLTSFAIAVLNRNLTNVKTVDFNLRQVGIKNNLKYHGVELWSNQDYGIINEEDKIEVTVFPTSAALIRLELAHLKNSNMKKSETLSQF